MTNENLEERVKTEKRLKRIDFIPYYGIVTYAVRTWRGEVQPTVYETVILTTYNAVAFAGILGLTYLLSNN